MSFRLIAVLVLMPALASAQESAKITNALDVEPGRKLHFVQTDTSTTLIDGDLLERSTESREFTLTFGAVQKDGATPATLTYSRIHGWREDQDGTRLEYDTLESIDIPIEDVQVRLRMLGKDMQTRFDSRGRMVHFSGMTRLIFGDEAPPNLDLDAGALGGFALVFAGFPEGGVETGGKWTDELSVPIMGMSMKGATNRVLRAARDDGIYVSSTGEYDVDMSGMPDLSGMKPGKMTAAGTMRLSRSTGLPDRAEWKQELAMSMAIEETAQTLKLDVTTKTSMSAMARPTTAEAREKTTSDEEDTE